MTSADRAMNGSRPPALDIVVPVSNAGQRLAETVEMLHQLLIASSLSKWSITIADQASEDATPCIGADLQTALENVRYLRLETAGWGRALKIAWSVSRAELLIGLHVEHPRCLAPLVNILESHASGDIDLDVRRDFRRFETRETEDLVVPGDPMAAQPPFGSARPLNSDGGFIAIRRNAAAQILPDVVDHDWFFDTEVLVLAERAGLRIHDSFEDPS